MIEYQSLIYFRRFDQDKFAARVNDVRRGIEDRLKQWAEYDASCEHLQGWLSDAETALKNFSPKSTIQEKQEQLDKYQVSFSHLLSNV